MHRARAVALLLALLVVSACSGSGLDDLSRSARDTTSSTSATTTTTFLPELQGVPLLVAEQGVTSFPDPYDDSQTLGGYGVVLQNPDATLMAVGVHVRTRILDAAGTELLVDNALLNAVMPGARMAVGRTLIEPIVGPTQLDVAIEVGAWLEPAGPGAFTAEEAVTEPEAFGGAVTRFAVRSSWPTDESGVDVTAVYRDADGVLLAAESTTIDELPAGAVALGQIRLLSPIPGLASTEVLVGRGFDAQTKG